MQFRSHSDVNATFFQDQVQVLIYGLKHLYWPWLKRYTALFLGWWVLVRPRWWCSCWTSHCVHR